MMVTLPLNEDLLWNIIENGQKQPLTIDVRTSFANLGDKILYYISNAELDVTFDWTNCDFDTKDAIITSYIELNRLYYNPQLIDTLFGIMMCYKGIEVEQHGIFTTDEVINYINNHVELVAKQIAFLDSVIILVCNGFAAITDSFKPENFEQINDNSISLNVVYLFQIPEFVAYYSRLDFNNLKWYATQFTQPLYNNEVLQNIVFQPNSGLAAAIYAVMTEQGIIKE